MSPDIRNHVRKDKDIERIQIDLSFILRRLAARYELSPTKQAVKVYERAALELSKVAKREKIWSWNYISSVYNENDGITAGWELEEAIQSLARKIRAKDATQKRNLKDLRLRPLQILATEEETLRIQSYGTRERTDLLLEIIDIDQQEDGIDYDELY